MDSVLADFVAKGELVGVGGLVARRGKVVHRFHLGGKSLAPADPLEQDTIFRIFSMTKPVTAVAMMMLHEEGLWSLDDPIARHLPEFADVRVLAGVNGDGSLRTEAPDHPPTMRELMSHTAGLAYGFDPADPVDLAYITAGVWGADDLREMARRVSSAPLAYQPGTRWRYSMGMEIEGALIEVLTGQSLPDFMRERIFRPLGMVDTDFCVAADKVHRLATVFRKTEEEGWIVMDQPPYVQDPLTIPKLPMGGGGLYSTIDDYARFAQLILDGGRLGDVRLLSEDSIRLMTTNVLSDELQAGGYGIGLQQIRPGFGHALNGAVFHDPAAAGSRVGMGTYQWDGAAGTWFWVDPANDLIWAGMIQRLLGKPHLQAITQDLIADALI